MVEVLGELLLQVGLLVLVEGAEVVDRQQVVARVGQEDAVEQASEDVATILVKRANHKDAIVLRQHTRKQRHLVPDQGRIGQQSRTSRASSSKHIRTISAAFKARNAQRDVRSSQTVDGFSVDSRKRALGRLHLNITAIGPQNRFHQVGNGVRSNNSRRSSRVHDEAILGLAADSVELQLDITSCRQNSRRRSSNKELTWWKIT